MITLFFDERVGRQIHNGVGKEYFAIHGAYPQIFTELPQYLCDQGYTVELVNIPATIYDTQRIGIKMEDHIATALVFRYCR